MDKPYHRCQNSMDQKRFYISQQIASLRAFGEVILLESQKKDHPASQRSFIAGKPKAWIKAKGTQIECLRNGEVEIFDRNPFVALQEFYASEKDWIFGYLGYDLKNHIEALSSNNEEVIEAADLFFMVPEVLIEVNETGDMEYLRGEPTSIDKNWYPSDVKLESKNQIKKRSYLKKIYQAKKRIREGEFYEINISHPIQYQFKGDSLDLYNKMEGIGAVPFAAYVYMDEVQICCASPERFIQKRGDKIISQPIKGTIQRKGNDTIADLQRFMNSEKERAENLMIVDLVRNDFSRVAQKGSVKVSKLFEIQTFETVHQMVSTVEAKVDAGVDVFSIIQACFPMGSMTGAPKIASMKAIEELEDYKRGIYSGAIGYIKPDGDFDFNVVIRTALVQGEKLVYPVGGAITSDSDPELEWEETLIKARALTRLLD